MVLHGEVERETEKTSECIPRTPCFILLETCGRKRHRVINADGIETLFLLHCSSKTHRHLTIKNEKVYDGVRRLNSNTEALYREGKKRKRGYNIYTYKSKYLPPLSLTGQMRHRQGGCQRQALVFDAKRENMTKMVPSTRGGSSVRHRQGGVNDRGYVRDSPPFLRIP